MRRKRPFLKSKPVDPNLLPLSQQKAMYDALPEWCKRRCVGISYRCEAKTEDFSEEYSVSVEGCGHGVICIFGNTINETVENVVSWASSYDSRHDKHIETLENLYYKPWKGSPFYTEEIEA